MSALGWLVPLAALACLTMPAQAVAKPPPVFGGFYSVLAFGEGEGTSDQDLARFEATGQPPAVDLSQDTQYEGLEQAWPGFTTAGLHRYFKNSDLHGRPSGATLKRLESQGGSGANGSPPAVETPRRGVLIVRDARFEVPRIYGTTRADVMWGAGYATAEDRLFFMDVLRHVAEGTESEILGPSAAASDSAEVGVQDDSPARLTAEMHSLPRTRGAEGAQALRDIEQYVAGINAFIQVTKRDPARLPAEYPALGITPKPWTLADSAALGVYLIGQFTVFGGQQPQQAEALTMARRRLGKRRGAAVYRDLRLAADPSAVVTIPRTFHSDNPGRVNPRSVAMVDPGSPQLRNAQTGKPERAANAPVDPHLPPWARRLATQGLRLPHLESNAVLVDAKRSGVGRSLAVMGPQVGYYTPEVFLEYELHAPGIDVTGVSFPGASPYPLIGHGIDFAWTGTSAYSANDDVFAERLCNPRGSRPSFASTHYLYRGRRARSRPKPSPCTRWTRCTDRSGASPPSTACPSPWPRPRPRTTTRYPATWRSCAWPRTSRRAQRASSRPCAHSRAARTGSTSTRTTSLPFNRDCSPYTRVARTPTFRSGAPAGGTGSDSVPPRTATALCPRAPTPSRSTLRGATWSTGTTPWPTAGEWPQVTGRTGR
jgi:hypothetical protein